MAVPPHPGAPPPSHSGPPLVRIALQIGATAVSRVDIATMLSGVCAALCPAAGVAGAVLLLTEPADPWDPRRLRVFASDPVANRLGVIQREAGRGPVHAAIRAERPLTVPDLTTTGPPELAAAAADCGLVRSLVVPVAVAGQAVGGLQLLSRVGEELPDGLVASLWPVVSALAARLSDVRELARLRTRPAETAPDAEAAGEPDAATGLVPLAEPVPAAVPPAASEDTRVAAVVPPVTDETTALPLAPAPEAARVAVPPAPDPVADLFASGEPSEDTPPMGQAELGWEAANAGATQVPARPLPGRVRVVGRLPRVPAAVPAQRSAPAPPLGPGRPPGPGNPAGTGQPGPANPGPAPVNSGPVPGIDPSGDRFGAGRPGTAQPGAGNGGPGSGPEPSPAVVAAGPPTGAPMSPGPSPSGTADPGADAPTWRVPRHRLRDDD